jgi:hypothetical protein
MLWVMVCLAPSGRISVEGDEIAAIGIGMGRGRGARPQTEPSAVVAGRDTGRRSKQDVIRIRVGRRGPARHVSFAIAQEEIGAAASGYILETAIGDKFRRKSWRDRRSDERGKRRNGQKGFHALY